MMFLPRAMSVTTDAQNAFSRLAKIFHAETLDDIPFIVDPEQEPALEAKKVSFQWEVIAAPSEGEPKGKGKTVSMKKMSSDGDVGADPFRVRDITLKIPRQSLVAIVGRVGSGKVN